MPGTYTGSRSGITARQSVVVPTPADGDPLTAASAAAGPKRNADFLDFVMNQAVLFDGSGRIAYDTAKTAWQFITPAEFVLVGGSAASSYGPPSRWELSGGANGAFMARVRLPPDAVISAVDVLYEYDAGGLPVTRTGTLNLRHITDPGGGGLPTTGTELLSSPSTVFADSGGSQAWRNLPLAGGGPMAAARGFTEFYAGFGAGSGDLTLYAIRVTYTHTVIGPLR